MAASTEHEVSETRAPKRRHSVWLVVAVLVLLALALVLYLTQPRGGDGGFIYPVH